MSNIIFGYNNLVGDATLTGGTFETNLPRDNLKVDKLAELAQTTTDDVVTIIATFSANQTIGCIALANHNFSSTCEIDIVVKNSGGGAIDSISGLAPYIDADRNNIVCWWMDANVTTSRSVEITITDTSNPNTFLSIGRLFIGKQFELERNADYGNASHGKIDLSDSTKSISGVKWSRTRAKLRTASIGIGSISESDMLIVDDLMQISGTTEDIIYAYTRPTYTDISGVLHQDELSYKRTFIGNLTSLDAINTPFFGRYSAQFSIEELAV